MIFFAFSIFLEIYLSYLYIALYNISNIFIYPSYIIYIRIQDLVYKFFNTCKIFCLKNIFVIIIIFTKWKFVSFVKKSVLVKVVYLSTCFTALNVSKNLQILAKSTTIIFSHKQANKSPRINQNLPKQQYATHPNKKVKTSQDNNFNFIAETSNFDLFELNYHNHSSLICDSSLLNQ